jgi:hypothetical protein
MFFFFNLEKMDFKKNKKKITLFYKALETYFTEKLQVDRINFNEPINSHVDLFNLRKDNPYFNKEEFIQYVANYINTNLVNSDNSDNSNDSNLKR